MRSTHGATRLQTTRTDTPKHSDIQRDGESFSIIRQATRAHTGHGKHSGKPHSTARSIRREVRAQPVLAAHDASPPAIDRGGHP